MKQIKTIDGYNGWVYFFFKWVGWEDTDGLINISRMNKKVSARGYYMLMKYHAVFLKIARLLRCKDFGPTLLLCIHILLLTGKTCRIPLPPPHPTPLLTVALCVCVCVCCVCV